MKKILLSAFFLTIFLCSNAADWVNIHSATPVPARISLVSSTIERSVVKLTLDGFSMQAVQTPAGPAYTIHSGESTPILEAGAPDLPKLTTSLVIPDVAGMSIRVISSQFRDYENIVVAPSKGVILRTTDPASVPFTYGKAYSADKFYPGLLADTRDPYIARDLRGQTIIAYPFQYNPVTKTLRVYYDVTVELVKSSETGVNPLIRSKKDLTISPDFATVFAQHFLNFDAIAYTPVNEYGNVLVICHPPFMEAMQPYVNWKNAEGYHTEMVSTTTTGSTAAQIKTYITDYYNTEGLTHVLLVGDGPQIPTNTGSGLGGPSDNAYGYLVGNDHYIDVYIGRFSAENVGQVNTQVARTLNYEMNPQLLTDDWYTTVIGIASDQGPGDDNEMDYEHIRNQQTKLLAYSYTMNPELFDGSQGGNDAAGNPTQSQVATEVNNGSSLIIYTGHGSQTSWGSSGFNNNNVNQLVNNGKLPFIWSVACVNGDFVNATCFAEAWLRASQNNEPTGAVAFLGSTINQSWDSPMEGQDEMTNVLVETYNDNIKRTFAGLSLSGCMQMIDAYGNDGKNMADTWTVFGDPTIVVRTANPTLMTVTHLPTVFVGSTSLLVNCNVNGARATLTINDTILATGLIASGSVTLTFPALTDPTDSLHLVVTAYNKVPYQADLPTITPNGPYVLYINNSVNDQAGNNNHAVDYTEDILLSVSVKNIGVEATTNLSVTLRCADPNISWSDTTELYGILAPNEQKQISDGFAFHTDNQIPDGHNIPLQVLLNDGTQSWSGSFSLTAHAPDLVMNSYVFSDTSGNNNGQLDPGEVAYLKITLENGGSAPAFGVNGLLLSVGPWVTVTPDTQVYGDMTPGQTAFHIYKLTVDLNAPIGTSSPFVMEMSADHGIQAAAGMNLIIGRIPALVIDLDGNTNSAPAMQQAIEALGIPVTYATTLPDSLDRYQSVFVSLGVYPNNTVLSGTNGQKLATYLDNGGRLYMEGGETWYADPKTAVHPKFYILGFNDGQGDLTQIHGETGTFTSGQNFYYDGDNTDIDRITFEGYAFTIFKNVTPSYGNAVAYEGSVYRTIGSSFEFGGLIDGTYPSTKTQLMLEYLNFFGIQQQSLTANFIGFPTNVEPGESVQFTDFSTGGANTWSWSFPGGVPETSNEQNPVVRYNTAGLYDVTLVAGNGTSTNTLAKSGYISVDFATSLKEKTKTFDCKVLPNPNNGNFLLSLKSDLAQTVAVSIYNSIGTMVYEEDGIAINRELAKPFSLSHLQDGVYLIKIMGEGGITTKKVLIRK
jgi:PKD repeat protein